MVPAGAQEAPPANGRIVYASVPQFTENSDIFVMNADGSEKTNLTNTPDVSESSPEWDPQGNRIVFVRGLPENDLGSYQGDIFVMDADGSNQDNVTETGVRGEMQPTWAPGGDRVAYAREVPGNVVENHDIFVLDLATGQATNITQSDYEEWDPSWSPVGERIAFSGVRDVPTTPEVDNDWEIVAIDSDGSNEQVLTAQDLGQHEDGSPDWSPDGEMVVYMSQHDTPCCGDWDIWAVNADGTGISNLTPGDGDSDLDRADWFPAWASDGSGITFERSSEEPGRFDIWVMTAPESLPTGTGNGGAASAAAAPTSAGGAPEARRLTFDGDSKSPDWFVEALPCTVTGTPKADVLEGTSGDDVICARGGDDEVTAGLGNDVVRAGLGTDRVRTGSGRDRLLGARGSDRLTGGDGRDRLRGGSGTDTLTTRDGVSGNDWAHGGGDPDTCRSDAGDITRSCQTEG